MAGTASEAAAAAAHHGGGMDLTAVVVLLAAAVIAVPLLSVPSVAPEPSMTKSSPEIVRAWLTVAIATLALMVTVPVTALPESDLRVAVPTPAESAVKVIVPLAEVTLP